MSKKKAKRTALRRRNRSDREESPDQARILAALNAARAPLSAEELAARLRVARHARREFEHALGALERAGDIVQNRAGALLVAKRIALIAGRVEGHPDGHGFLIPDQKGTSIGSSIFLPPAQMRQLMHRDRASVRVSGHDHRGRRCGGWRARALRRSRPWAGRDDRAR